MPRYRVEDDRFLTGRGRFVEDLAAEDAHARIEAIDAEDAAAVQGVAAVLTGTDLAAAGLLPMHTALPMDSFDGTPFREPDRHALAIGMVRFVGEPVVLVLAETPEQAADAGELVMVDYADEPAQIDAAQSRDVAFTWKLGDEGATRAALANAAHRVTITEVNNRVVAAPVEPRSAIGAYDSETDSYLLRTLLRTQTQGVHLMRRLVAASLDITPDRLRVVTPDVGGSFGMKLVAYPEQVAILAAARLTGRPVRWAATRTESMLSDTHGRDHVSEATLALDDDGLFRGLEILTHGNLGAYASAFAPLTVSAGFAKTAGSVYRLPVMALTARAVYTNTAPTDAYRGAGKPESVHLMERLVDKAAAETGIDRIELRRRNLVTPAEMPCTAASGIIWKDADFPAVLERTLAASDWPNRPLQGACAAMGWACICISAAACPTIPPAWRWSPAAGSSSAPARRISARGRKLLSPKSLPTGWGSTLPAFACTRATARRYRHKPRRPAGLPRCKLPASVSSMRPAS
jgi:carbon-monoxide dehydrogenase large subunit